MFEVLCIFEPLASLVFFQTAKNISLSVRHVDFKDDRQYV